VTLTTRKLKNSGNIYVTYQDKLTKLEWTCGRYSIGNGKITLSIWYDTYIIIMLIVHRMWKGEI